MTPKDFILIDLGLVGWLGWMELVFEKSECGKVGKDCELVG